MSKTFIFLNDMPAPKGPPSLGREIYFKPNRPGGEYYDPSLKRTFTSKHAMRAYLTRHGMRDAGERINPNKHIEGRLKSRPDPNRQAIDAYIQSQGGTEGLLRKFSGGR